MPPNTLRVHTEHVLVKSVGPKALRAKSRVQGSGEYFPPPQFHAKIVEVEIGGVAIYHPFGGFRRANSYCRLYGAQSLGQTTGVLLAPCHDVFRGPRSDYVRQEFSLLALKCPHAAVHHGALELIRVMGYDPANQKSPMDPCGPQIEYRCSIWSCVRYQGHLKTSRGSGPQRKSRALGPYTNAGPIYDP
ncbi:uncharacterized protein TNCV_3332311 [Trichonephila clavipes]|nr:uncharacterized protein TNCV_3332311 [Trichonephila clavipes]